VSNDQVTIGKYKLVNCMASGQYSQVWEAIDNETTRRVAMKLLLPEALKSSEQVGSLKNEFRIGAHP
jgi:serine/threonine-protein kinase